jgi:hypothetical protein
MFPGAEREDVLPILRGLRSVAAGRVLAQPLELGVTSPFS